MPDATQLTDEEARIPGSTCLALKLYDARLSVEEEEICGEIDP